jgi:hypothetical protein
MYKKLKFLTLALLLLPLTVYAHSGRTDSSGCHTNRKTGDYHCHTKKSSSSRTVRSSTRITVNSEAKTEARTEARNETKVENNNQKVNDCLSDKFNCSDFSLQIEAQAIFQFCGGADNDIYQLDKDKDGIACDELLNNN